MPWKWKLNLQKKGVRSLCNNQFSAIHNASHNSERSPPTNTAAETILTLFSMNNTLIYDSMSLAKYHKQLNLFLGNLEKCVRKDQIVDAIHPRIRFEFRVYVKEHLRVESSNYGIDRSYEQMILNENREVLTGMLIVSPGRSRCSSKQKHCILLK